MPRRHPPFTIAVDLDRGLISGSPAPHECGPLVIAVAGYFHGCVDTPAADDLETLAVAYAAHGWALSATLLGAFAGVIVDLPQRRLTVVQDSLGLHAVFYRLAGSVIEISTRLESLVARLAEVAVDADYFAEYLTSTQYPVARTPFTGIHRMRPGTSLVWSGHRLEERRPWAPDSTIAPLPWGEASERLRALVVEAVDGQAPRRGRVVCELSGGLDSTTVLWASRLANPGAEALTVVSSASPVADDDELAAEIVRAGRLRWHRLDVAEHAAFATMPDVFSAEPGSEIDFDLRAAYEALLTREQIDVVMSGVGGDIIFGGPGARPMYLADAVAAGHLRAARRLARTWSRAGAQPRHWVQPLLHMAVPVAWKFWRGRRPGQVSDLDPPTWLSRGLRARVASIPWRSRRTPRMGRPSQQLMWELVMDSATALAAVRHPHIDAEMRHPLLHRPLVEFMSRLDASFSFDAAGNRRLQRHALADCLPRRVVTRQSKGNPQRGYDLALARAGPHLERLFCEPRVCERGWVDAAAWRAEFARARLGVVPNRPQFEATLMTELWLRAVESKRPRPAPPLVAPRPRR
jgi:asparagine synthase (glutamine-hydrolysing)